MNGLKQLLIDLAKDAELQDQYESAPEKIMKQYNFRMKK